MRDRESRVQIYGAPRPRSAPRVGGGWSGSLPMGAAQMLAWDPVRTRPCDAVASLDSHRDRGAPVPPSGHTECTGVARTFLGDAFSSARSCEQARDRQGPGAACRVPGLPEDRAAGPCKVFICAPSLGHSELVLTDTPGAHSSPQGLARGCAQLPQAVLRASVSLGP